MKSLLRPVLVSAACATALLAGLVAGSAEAQTPPPPTMTGVDLAIAAYRDVDDHYQGLHTRHLAHLSANLGTPGTSRRFWIQACNRGGDVGRISLRGTPGSTRFRVRYLNEAGTNITRGVVAGTYRVRPLAEGSCAKFRMVLSRAHARTREGHRWFTVVATPSKPGAAHDRVAVEALNQVEPPPGIAVVGVS